MLQVEMELGRPAESSIDSLGKVASKSEQGFVKLDNLLRGPEWQDRELFHWWWAT
jgi:hypothetical protein